MEYETIAGGHWSSSDKIMEENGEKAYNEAVESMGEIYSRTVDQLLYQVPAINNLYLGSQYSMSLVNESSKALKKTGTNLRMYNSLIKTTNIINGAFIAEELYRDYYRDGMQWGFNLNKDFRKEIGGLLGGAVGGAVGGFLGPYGAIIGSVFGSSYISNFIEKNAYEKYIWNLQPNADPTIGMYYFFNTY